MWVIMSHFSHSSSTLNPNAPMFVPMAYRSVEDFSDQWWALVQSCPWFRDYWLQERFHDPQSELAAPDQTPFPNANGFCCDPHAEAEAEADLPDDDDLDDYYSLFFNQQEDQEEEMMMMMMMREYYNNNSMNSCRDLVSMKKRRKGARPLVRAPPWIVEKPPKIVNVKVSPRTINQPK